MKLTADELAFLKKYNLSPNDVYDGRNQSQVRRKMEAERLGKILVLGSPCSKAGHRLRMRAGHCFQCDPKKLAFQKRHSEPGYVYIAGSLSGRLIKIGTTEFNLRQRHLKLRWESYGGLSDWELLFWAKVNEGGRVEQSALTNLEGYRVMKKYTKDGMSQVAVELLQCRFSSAIEAVSNAMGGAASDFWRPNDWQIIWPQYEFKS